MPTKKDLAALLSETPQPPLHRGRGLRLSRAAKQSKELSLEAGARLEPSTPVAKPPVKPAAGVLETVDAAVESLAVDSESDTESVVLSEPEQLKPVREKRKLQLRKDLLKECKRIARAQDRKLYQVIESALESYIQRHGARE